jgi:hypothetical protein
VESLTIVDLGFCGSDHAEDLLRGWIDGNKSQGEIRKWMEQELWPRYGVGLWSEPWAAFFASLAKAVQPYSHYSSELMSWQPSIEGATEHGDAFLLLAKIAVKNYDCTRATRITLLHSILVWALMRLLEVHQIGAPVAPEAVRQLGASLGSSEYLEARVTDWSRQFWPWMWDEAV